MTAPPRPAANNNILRAQPDPVADLSLGPGSKQSPLSQLTGLGGAHPGGIDGAGGLTSSSNGSSSLEALSADGLVAQWKANVKQMAALLVQRDSGDPAGRPAINQQLKAVALAAVGLTNASPCSSQRCGR